MKVYSQEYIIRKLQKALNDPKQLYKQSCVKYSGKTSEGIYYTEIISQILLSSDFVNNPRIEAISRKNYKTMSHDGSKGPSTIRLEEIFAKNLYKKELGDLGQIVDYQTPLKLSRADKGVGKIDLVSFKGNDAYVIELKCANNVETLLRAVLEIWTYSYQIADNFVPNIFGANSKIKNIKRAVLLVSGCKSFEEANDLGSNNRINLRKLIKKLGVNVFLLNGTVIKKCNL